MAAKLLISEFLANPSGTDSPFEYVELIATETIDFSATPYTVVFANNGTASANGWVAGSGTTYGFSLTSGTVNAGDVVYVGGSSMAPTGTKLRTINTGTTAGDGFGNANSSGVLGNGGSNADAVAVFDQPVAALTANTVPVDAVFFGTGLGTAIAPSGGYQLPVNDLYNGGLLQASSFLALDPGAGTLVATGTYNATTGTFSTARTWTAGSLSDGTSGITVVTQPPDPTNTAPTISAIAPLSGVVNDPTNPGVSFTVNDTETALNDLVVTATATSNTGVVSLANVTVSGTGANRTVSINPTGVGFANITLTVTDGGGLSTSTVLNYAASAASVAPTTTRFHTGTSDASTAVAVDSEYMLVADDEDQKLRLYDRYDSGLPVASFDFTSALGLTDLSGGVPREVDIEASTRVGNRIYWLASHSNSSGGNNRPNRSRLFATDISGTGAATTLTFVGSYSTLKSELLAWGDANGYDFTASAAVGNIPEDPQLDGFNIEGLTMAPNGTTAYVAFRAPNVPTSNRTKALIAPITNFADLVTGAATSATIGAPIELDLGGRGIRSIDRNSNNQYVIIAGPADGATGTAPKDFRLYTWTGNAGDAPVLRATDLTALNTAGSFESIVEVPDSLTDTTQIQLLVDNGDTQWYGTSTISKDLPQDNFQKFRSELVTLGAGATPAIQIHDIQGSSHRSPLVGTTVTNVQGIVTGIIATGSSRGFYMQDPNGDGDDATSEGIFVFRGSSWTPPAGFAVGSSVQVMGRVDEFRKGNDANNLTVTQINTSSSVSGAAVSLIGSIGSITSTLLGAGGRTIPNSVINDDFTSGGNVETGGDFDPVNDGIDFYESLEGMVVQVNNPRATSPTNNFGEFWVLADNGANATGLTPRGGSIISATDFNPERIQVDDTLLGTTSPQVDVGAQLSTISGIVDYSFNNYELLATTLPTVTTPSPLNREVTTLLASAEQLTVATFNVENLDPGDGAAKFNDLASRIVTNLGAPDIISLEEVQDNNGATNDSVVDATATYTTLINAIAAAGGPTYEFRQIDPTDDQDGGEPGGNIRVGFLFNPSRVQFVDRPGGTATSSTTVTGVNGAPQLSASPGRLDPTNSAFSSSRKPLVGEFVFNGKTVFVVGNHFNSKGGDQPLYGPNQPPTLTSEVQRKQQAQVVNDFVDSILAVDANANIIVLGDLNDFPGSEPLNVLQGIPGGVGTPVLRNLIDTLPASDRYTYNFQGNAQTLDHILVSNGLFNQLNGYDIVHINSEFADQVSDHDPSVARFGILAGIVGTPNDDTLTGTPGNDLMRGLAGNDILSGGSGNDQIEGGDGNDQINGQAGNDTLLGGNGNDFLIGSLGTDTLTGGAGNDQYRVNATSVVIEEANGGTDTIRSVTTWTLATHFENLLLLGTADINGTGNEVNNVITGNAGANQLRGETGNDTLRGGAGNDQLIGGIGNDRLIGGADNDTFTLNAANEGVDTITDFAAGDVINLSGLFDSLGYTGSNPVADRYLRIRQAGANSLLQLDSNGATGGLTYVNLLVVQNVGASTLTVGTNVLV
jgi:predicted extracellular nuclease